MKTVLVLLIICAFLIIAISGFAEIEKMGFENQHTIRTTIRSDDDDDDLYLTRACGYVDYNFPQINRTIRISPFFEYQSNFDTNTWWRKELGAEIGTFFYKDYIYVGSSFQHVWQKEENYPIELLEETTEWEARFVVTSPIQWGIFKDKVKLRLFDEYTYDFTRGQATFNDVGVVFEWQILKGLWMPVGWRHTDRVHDFDTDMLEFSLLFSF